VSRIITEIKPQKRSKSRFNLYAEEGFFLSLSEESILKYGLRAGKEVDEGLLAELRAYDTEKYAKELSMAYIARSPKTEKQVRRRLAERDIDPTSIDAAVSALYEYGYLGDEAYVREFARSYEGKLGERAIRQKLLQNGVEEETIDSALKLDGQAQYEAARKVAETYEKRYAGEPALQVKARIYAALLRKGFGGDMIDRVLKKEE